MLSIIFEPSTHNTFIEKAIFVTYVRCAYIWNVLNLSCNLKYFAVTGGYTEYHYCIWCCKSFSSQRHIIHLLRRRFCHIRQMCIYSKCSNLKYYAVTGGEGQGRSLSRYKFTWFVGITRVFGFQAHIQSINATRTYQVAVIGWTFSHEMFVEIPALLSPFLTGTGKGECISCLCELWQGHNLIVNIASGNGWEPSGI